jgi:uncharacterized protein YjiS (DUF1127 family)
MNITANMNKQSNIVEGAFERGVFTRMADKFTTWNEHRQAVRQLSAMSDRMLKDIGIERYEIADAVKQPRGLTRLDTKTTSISQGSLDIQKAA